MCRQKNSSTEGRGTRLMALVIAISFHIAIGGLMVVNETGIPPGPLEAPVEQDSVLEVVFIRRKEAFPAVPRTELTFEKASSRSLARRARVSSTPIPGDQRDHGADAPRISPERPLDLRVPQDGIDSLRFRSRQPLLGLPPDPDPFERGPSLALTFKDRSFGGRLQRMQRSAVCHELRRAAVEARRTGASSELSALVRSMQQSGC